MTKEPERKDDQADVDKLVGDLEAHSLRDEVPGSDDEVAIDDTGTCTCGTCGCGEE
jgi:hypothetical protein